MLASPFQAAAPRALCSTCGAEGSSVLRLVVFRKEAYSNDSRTTSHGQAFRVQTLPCRTNDMLRLQVFGSGTVPCIQSSLQRPGARASGSPFMIDGNLARVPPPAARKQNKEPLSVPTDLKSYRPSRSFQSCFFSDSCRLMPATIGPSYLVRHTSSTCSADHQSHASHVPLISFWGGRFNPYLSQDNSPYLVISGPPFETGGAVSRKIEDLLLD